MKEPWFWRDDGVAAHAAAMLLSPLAFAYSAGQNLRWRMTTPARANVPVICIGNASVGGVGKTPFAILTAKILRQLGATPYFLARGYGGHAIGPLRVEPDIHNSETVGDEPLLLARHAPTVIAKNRVDGARFAQTSGADVIVLDDGFQNPSLHKDFSVLLYREDDNRRRQFPAGPMREALAQARNRASIDFLVGAAPDESDTSVNCAWLTPAGDSAPRSVFAFCGIGSPNRFFETLKKYGFELKGVRSFADHHPYSARDIEELRNTARQADAELITTEKDFVRIPGDRQDEIDVFPVEMQISNPDQYAGMLLALLQQYQPSLSNK